ncbi:MAG: hypothetical protein LBN05_02045 [Oscillospiraceae bacterium]|jgi:hypothetical protein|nr:hypothetical protein [Oscillospiraceae bacterium]
MYELFPCVRDELQAYAPSLCTGVREMEAIWQVIGALADRLFADIGRVADNAILSTADAAMLARLETFLRMPSGTGNSLAMRRAVLQQIYAGQKVNAEWIRARANTYVPGTNCNTALVPIEGTDAMELHVTLFVLSGQAFPVDAYTADLRGSVPAHLQISVSVQTDQEYDVPLAGYSTSGIVTDIQEAGNG